MDNFLVEFCPSSLASPSATVPRVFLIDFESAVSFEPDSLPEDRLVTSHYFGDSLARQLAPEQMQKGVPFDPFALDIWQLAKQMLMFSVRRRSCTY